MFGDSQIRKAFVARNKHVHVSDKSAEEDRIIIWIPNRDILFVIFRNNHKFKR